MYKLQFKDQPNKSLWLVGESLKIGSHTDNDIVLDGLGIEPFHVEIVIGDENLTLVGDDNCCIINDLPVDSGYQLQVDDELRVGSQRLLIIDPKQQVANNNDNGTEETENTSIVVDEKPDTGWSLLPLHPKLKSNDYQITSGTRVGRAKDCEFSIAYKMLSREHAVFEQRGDDLYLRDLGSSNGTFVNGERIKEAILNNDDVIAFAKLSFTVHAPNDHIPQQESVDNNMTLVRPAVDLARLTAETGSQEIIDLDFDEPEDNQVNEQAIDKEGQSRRWPFVVLGLVALAFVAYFFTSA